MLNQSNTHFPDPWDDWMFTYQNFVDVYGNFSIQVTGKTLQSSHGSVMGFFSMATVLVHLTDEGPGSL